MTADSWPIVQEKLGELRNGFDELVDIITTNYYPGEKEEIPAGPGPGLGPSPGPEMRPY